MEDVIGPARAAARAAAERAGVEVREVHDPREAARLVEVLNAVWGTDVDIIDHAFLTALAHAGCYVAAAYRGAEMVGAGVAFFGAEPGVVHSHVLGARPGHASRGVGQAVKAHSRVWCLERGIARMTWTYDPLQARNTYLNLHVFGAELADYVDDFYGDLKDGLNDGVPTDRAVLTWDVAHPREPLGHVPPDLAVVLGREGDRPTGFTDPGDAAPGTLVRLAIPRDVDALRRDDPDAALGWAHTARHAFHTLRAAGWAPRDATKDAWIVWEKVS